MSDSYLSLANKGRVIWAGIAGVSLIIDHYGLTEGSLVIDDSENKRSKNTKKIWHVHTLKDKMSGGYVMGQGLVFMGLVTPVITLPVGIEFYMPDPNYSPCKKTDDKLKKAGVPARQRPPKPVKKAEFPTKIESAVRLVKQFHTGFPEVTLKCVMADALYGTGQFFQGVSDLYPKVQILSQIKKSQNVLFRNRKMTVRDYFLKQAGGHSRFEFGGRKNDSPCGQCPAAGMQSWQKAIGNCTQI